jgi:hypothetical protein
MGGREMKYLLFALAAASISMSSPALGQSLPLNTGYNYNSFSVYPQPAGGTSTVSDNYWIKIASYEPPTPSVPVAPAWVLPAAPPPPWAAPLTVVIGGSTIGSRWIGPRPVAASSPGTSVQNPAYSVFRKCFCLMQGYQNPQLSFQVRADDKVQVWLNSVTNTLVPAQIGNWGSNAINSLPTNPAQFQTGRNCVYVLVEDNLGGHMGFDLAGSVSALGLMPVAGAGTNVSFAPCQCGGPAGTASAAPAANARASRSDDDSAVVQAIIKIAEARRTRRPAQ